MHEQIIRQPKPCQAVEPNITYKSFEHISVHITPKKFWATTTTQNHASNKKAPALQSSIDKAITSKYKPSHIKMPMRPNPESLQKMTYLCFYAKIPHPTNYTTTPQTMATTPPHSPTIYKAALPCSRGWRLFGFPSIARSLLKENEGAVATQQTGKHTYEARPLVAQRSINWQ